MYKNTQKAPANMLYVLMITLLASLALSSATIASESKLLAEADQDSLIATGVMKSKRTSLLGAIVPGIVDHVYVNVGDRVETGLPLFRIRQRDYELSLRQAKAIVQLASAKLTVSRKKKDRAKELFQRNNVSESFLDESVAVFKITEAELAVANAKLDVAKQALADTVFQAPYRGTITRRLVNEGIYKTVQSFSADGGIVELQEDQIMVAILFLPVKYISAIRIGQTAILKIDGLKNTMKGKVSAINHQAMVASNMIELRVPVENHELIIKDGQRVTAHIQITTQITTKGEK
tara:strand:- start:4932 stop:5807 length:876 start_codon:yes stop_codon:yes gene_type:complete